MFKLIGVLLLTGGMSMTATAYDPLAYAEESNVRYNNSIQQNKEDTKQANRIKETHQSKMYKEGTRTNQHYGKYQVETNAQRHYRVLEKQYKHNKHKYKREY